jgi:hypothetical protein
MNSVILDLNIRQANGTEPIAEGADDNDDDDDDDARLIEIRFVPIDKSVCKLFIISMFVQIYNL